MPINVAKIYSTLGNPNSLIPLAVKDISSTAGVTAGSFITGKEEGQDRLIDELGTEVIWLLGIPAFKKLFDLTVFKAEKLDAEFDPRNFKDKKVLEKVKEYAQTEEVKQNIEKIIKNKQLFKYTAISKFLISTAATLATYAGLTKFKQNYTEKEIRKNLIEEYNKQKKQNEENSAITRQQNQNPSFKGLMKVAEYFSFSPVRNMWVLDAFITGERLYNARTPQEFYGYAIKEFSVLFFMYFAGNKIQNMVEKLVKNKYKKSIDLDARVLESDSLKKSFEDGSIEKSLEQFASIADAKKECNIKNEQGSFKKFWDKIFAPQDNKLKKDSVSLYDFLHKNPDNIVVKSAKQSDIIKTCKDTGKIDTRKYIDLEEIEKTNSKINELYTQYKDALKNGETSEQFFKKLKKLKRGSILTNIGTCILALGVITPAIMVLKRYTNKDDAEFETKRRIREELIEEGVIA